MQIKHKIPFIFTIRQAISEDIEQILRLDNEVWQDFPATEKMISSRIEIFPEGNLVAVYRDKIVGYLCLQFINYNLEDHPPFTWNEITDYGTLCSSHNLNGEYMYGVAMTVSPKFQNFNIATRLMFAGWSIIVKYNKRGCMLGSRIPNFFDVKDKYSPEEYIHLKRADGKLSDDELRLYDSDGFKIICALPNYETDPESCNYGVLVYQANPFYNKGFNALRKLLSIILAKWGHKILGV